MKNTENLFFPQMLYDMKVFEADYVSTIIKVKWVENQFFFNFDIIINLREFLID